MPMVYVVWEDAACDPRYDGPRHPDAGSTLLMHDLGFLYASDSRVIKLASSCCPSQDSIRFVSVIPRRLVRSLRVMRSLARPRR